MKLYFMRHGIAEDGSGSDFDRALTPRGRKRLEVTARVLAAMDIQPTRIYSSPRVRALQTAEIVAGALRLPVQTREEVNFGFDVRAVETLIQGVDDRAEVLFVGHEPSMSQTLHALTGANVEMKKGSLARVDVMGRNPLAGVLVWLIAPRVFLGVAEAMGEDD